MPPRDPTRRSAGAAPASTLSGQVSPLSTADGVRLHALFVPAANGAGPADPGSFAVVIAPGFSGSGDKAAIRAMAADLHVFAPSAGLLLVDLRGHGRSAGVSTLGDREVLDIDAAVVAMRRLGYGTVLTLGWSMGGSCVLRHSALEGTTVHGCTVAEHVDAVATVSALSRWDVRDTAAMRRLHLLALTRIGRLVARRVFGVRIDPVGWAGPPMPPGEAAALLRVPLLVVHGTADSYFGVEHGEALAAAAPASRLWVVEGLGHAEEAAVRPDVPGLLERLAAALGDLAAGRPVPPWDAPAGGPA